MERERNEILRFQKCSGDRMPPVLFNVWNDVPASKFTIQLKNCKKRLTVPKFRNPNGGFHPHDVEHEAVWSADGILEREERDPNNIWSQEKLKKNE